MKKAFHILGLLMAVLLPPIPTNAQETKAHVVFIGNSITEARWLKTTPPSQVANYLEKRGCLIKYSNCGVSGSTTHDFLPSPPGRLYTKVTDAADKLNDGSTVLIFSVMLGTNDSAIKGPTGSPVSPEKYRENLQTLIDSLKTRYATARFVLHRPLWYSPTTHNNGATYLQEGLDRLHTYTPELEALVKRNPDYVFKGDRKAYGFFRKNYLQYYGEEKGNSGTFYLHPNEAGNKKLAEYWGNVLYKYIQKWNKEKG